MNADKADVFKFSLKQVLFGKIVYV